MPTLKKSPSRPWIKQRQAYEGICHSNMKFYQSTAWRKLRSLKLEQYPLCEECHKNGSMVRATMVDHIVPINKGGAALDISNLQSLCGHCHARKSAKDRK